MKDSTKKFAAGAALVAVAGYITGVLTAPKSGRETRKDLKDAAVTSKYEAERQLKRLHTELSDVIALAKDRGEKLSGEAQKELEKATHATRQVKEAVRDILSAVHEGRAEDKDLHKAVTDAQKAVDHLKGYIKKRTK